MKDFFKKLGIFFKSAAERWRRKSPAFWRWVNRTGLAIVGVITTTYAPDAPLIGDFFAVELQPMVSKVLSYVYTVGWCMVFLSRLAVKDEPAMDKELEK